MTENRDLHIVRQSCLKAAAAIAGTPADVIQLAQTFVDWVFSEQGDPLPAEQPSPSLVAPLPETPTEAVPRGCPKCAGELYDNRLPDGTAQFSKNGKRLPRFKCRSKTCDWAVW